MIEAMSKARIGDLPNYIYDDYCQWKGDWELIDGIPYAMTPSPVIVHQAIASKIVSSLDNAIEDCTECLVLHEQDWKISESTTVRPDVALVCSEPGDAYITKRPEIIFEVISKSSVQKDEQIKFRLYAEEGVPYYIVVYPDDLKARAFRLKDGYYRRIADFFDEDLAFDDLPCKVGVDFDMIFRRFR